jgi:hypothetical protein
LIELASVEEPVIGEPGKVYSTAPRIASATDGRTFYIKNKSIEVIFKEVTGCRLAASCGLKVPDSYLCEFQSEIYAGVVAVPKAQRSMRPWLKSMDKINNTDDLYNVIAVDTWLANNDRNMGNLVGCASKDGRIDVYMIDFEASLALGPNPFTSTAIDPKALWPTAELGAILKVGKPKECPQGILEKIHQIQEKTIRSVVQPTAETLGGVTWSEDSIEVLLRRAAKIDAYVHDVWSAV